MTGKRSHQNKRANRLAKYGMTEDQYQAIYEIQEKKCAICGALPKSRRLAVDHSHKTGYVRGLLCYRCNYALGLLRDDATVAQAVVTYLNRKHVYPCQCRHKQHRIRQSI